MHDKMQILNFELASRYIHAIVNKNKLCPWVFSWNAKKKFELDYHNLAPATRSLHKVITLQHINFFFQRPTLVPPASYLWKWSIINSRCVLASLTSDVSLWQNAQRKAPLQPQFVFLVPGSPQKA